MSTSPKPSRGKIVNVLPQMQFSVDKSGFLFSAKLANLNTYAQLIISCFEC